MSSTTLQSHRQRLADEGLKRVEILARGGDIRLLRDASRILRSEAAGADRIRSLITELAPKRVSFRDWLLDRSA